jgi:hypothetical protein
MFLIYKLFRNPGIGVVLHKIVNNETKKRNTRHVAESCSEFVLDSSNIEKIS